MRSGVIAVAAALGFMLGGCGGYGRLEACNDVEKAERIARWRACPAELAASGAGADATPE